MFAFVFSRRVFTQIAGSIIAFAYQKWSKSWYRDDVEIDRLDEVLERGEDVILVFWHGKFIPLFALLEGHNTTVFTSDCFRGEVISHICQRFGYQPSLIPPGGQGNAYRHVQKVLKTANLGAFAVDGPLGPNHEPKPGAVKLASKLGHLIVPVSMACDGKRVLTKRWDKRELPHWGATVSLAVGDPIRIPAGLRARDIAEWNEKVKVAIDEVDRRAQGRIEDV
jgi:lysophospholipid acyltransferase (LPLAT)-like uncharacterized protein